jgi:hypothetical protein
MAAKLHTNTIDARGLLFLNTGTRILREVCFSEKYNSVRRLITEGSASEFRFSCTTCLVFPTWVGTMSWWGEINMAYLVQGYALICTPTSVRHPQPTAFVSNEVLLPQLGWHYHLNM